MFDTSRATLRHVSLPVLDEVLSMMKRHSWIAKVRFEGHTDSRGKAGKKLALSSARSKVLPAHPAPMA